MPIVISLAGEEVKEIKLLFKKKNNNPVYFNCPAFYNAN